MSIRTGCDVRKEKEKEKKRKRKKEKVEKRRREKPSLSESGVVGCSGNKQG